MDEIYNKVSDVLKESFFYETVLGPTTCYKPSEWDVLCLNSVAAIGVMRYSKMA